MSTENTACPEFIRALLEPTVYDHVVKNLQLIETHISWIILTGDFAYKIKKPVNLGFLDFSTLEKRHFCCQEEVRLNSRLAASIYLDVIKITGCERDPVLNGKDKVLEYAIKMYQFPQQAQFDNMLAAGKLNYQHLEAVAHMVAAFHLQVEKAAVDTAYGDPQHVYQPVEECFRQIHEYIQSKEYDEQLSELETWCKQEHERLISVFKQRKRKGYIRECHGDMHLRNLAWYQNAPIAFDCLEFNPALRWIDTMSDFSFLFMDLHDKQQPGMAQYLINIYLEHCGDYEGLAVLPFYLVYRALVRAKVSAIRGGQDSTSRQEKFDAIQEFTGYLDLASRFTHVGDARLLITRGLSASGKSTVSGKLIAYPGIIRIRSDVERKRLSRVMDEAFSQSAKQSNKTVIDAGIYSADATRQTYNKMAELAAAVLNAGFMAIIDATFLQYEQRAAFQQLALKMRVPYIILEFMAPAEVLRQRIQSRKKGMSDADLQVLEHQLLCWRPLQAEEYQATIMIDTRNETDIDALYEMIRSKWFTSSE